MAKPAVEIGETFRKPDSPSIVWIVDRFKLTIGLEHVELTRLDDPTTRITVSERGRYANEFAVFCSVGCGARLITLIEAQR